MTPIEMMAAAAVVMMACSGAVGYMIGYSKRQYRDSKGRFRKPKEGII